MTVSHYSAILLIYLYHIATAYYIKISPSNEPFEGIPVYMQSSFFNGDNGARYRITQLPREEGIHEYLAEFENDATDVDKQVTADQINNLLRNAWLG